VVCPWHGSTFRLTDGSVVHGPATAPQPSFETRIRRDGVIQVRPAHRS
jgi:nitrite reductase/ring-hydroxylating ferredoxin subunit